MHDNGLTDLGNQKGKPTRLQMTIYVMAKSYWGEKKREEAKNDSSSGSGSNKTLPSNNNRTTERQFDWSKEIANSHDGSDDEENPLFQDRDTTKQFVDMQQ